MIGHCLFPTDTLLGPKGVYFTSSVLGSLVYSIDSKNGTRERGKAGQEQNLGERLSTT